MNKSPLLLTLFLATSLTHCGRKQATESENVAATVAINSSKAVANKFYCRVGDNFFTLDDSGKKRVNIDLSASNELKLVCQVEPEYRQVWCGFLRPSSEPGNYPTLSSTYAGVDAHRFTLSIVYKDNWSEMICEK